MDVWATVQAWRCTGGCTGGVLAVYWQTVGYAPVRKWLGGASTLGLVRCEANRATARCLACSILGTAEACALNPLVVSRLPGEENDHGPGSVVVSNPCADACTSIGRAPRW
jgi:hypothetical protein